MVVTMKRGRRANSYKDAQFTEKWADRKTGPNPRAPKTMGSNTSGVWSDEQDAWLKQACTTAMTYGNMVADFNAAFPNDIPKSRSAILARANRKGYNNDKPESSTTGSRGIVVTRTAGHAKRKRDSKIKLSQDLAPVKFKGEPDGLRDDAEPLLRRSHPHMYRKTAEQIKEAKKGRLPCIVEDKPLTSVDFLSTARDTCKWPTNEDVREMQVCGEPTKIGAYCERHGRVAYVTLPTVKRNRVYHKDDTEYRAGRKAINDADAQWIADNVLDDVVETGDIELIPNFIGLLNE